MSFFRKSLSLPMAADSKVPRCSSCGLYRNCNSPKMPVDGKGKRWVLILGEAPGAEEDEQGKPFVGRAGQRLQDTLEQIGIDMRRDCWITNSLICRPGKRNETPTSNQIEWCRPNLTNAIEKYQPDVVILLGGIPVKSMIGGVWKEDPGGIGRWVGFQVPSIKPNAWLCPTFHPSYLERMHDPLLDLFFKRHLKAAFKLKGKPWEQPPDYADAVRVELDPAKAANAIRVLSAFGKPLAFDYETDRLKPDHPDAAIISCSVSDGQTSVSFPWVGEVVKQMREFLRSDVPKIASNLKFEHRWSKAVFGVTVKNWLWDTMLAAHVLDSRSDITGIKFQGYAMTGAPSWDDRVKPFLKSRGGSGNDKNRIRECNLNELLLYGGLDSLHEHHVAMRQMKLLGAKA